MANYARLLSITARSTKIATKTIAKNVDKVDDVAKIAEDVANATPKVTKGLSEIGAKLKEKIGKCLSEVFQKTSSETDDALESLLKIHEDPNVHFPGVLEEALKIDSNSVRVPPSVQSSNYIKSYEYLRINENIYSSTGKPLMK